MRNNPFGSPETAVDRFLREERERAALYRNVLGHGGVGEEIRQATEHHKLMRGLDFGAPYRGVMDTLERERKEREAFKKLTTTAWALSVIETARDVAKQHAGFIAEQRRFSSSVLDTVRAFDANRSAVGAAIAAASASDSYKRMITDALPRMSMFGAIAERMLMVDTLTLRASEGEMRSATAIAAEMVIEAQRIAEAIAEAPTDDEGARLYQSLIDALLRFLTDLGPNTIPELQRMGLVSFVSFVITVLSLYTLIPQQSAQSAEAKAAFAQLNAKVDSLEEKARRYHEAEVQSEQQYLAELPRAELSRNATFRRNPARDGQVVLKAPKGMEMAIAGAQGPWRLVVFRDPLSNQLAQAWVYATAVTLLAPPLPVDERDP
ncbi:MAG TPA: hypothetical protein VF650_17350 [Allosphingosinicella sp.]|jgi:hypothetical protein